MDEKIINEKLLEVRFSKLISNMQEAVLVESEHGEIILANKAFCTMFGYDCEPEELIGIDCKNAAEESKGFFKNSNKFAKRLTSILDTKEKVLGEALQMVNGRHLERDYMPVYLEGEYMGHMWKYRDVTAEKRIIRNLSISKKEVEDKNKELAKFARVVSNDLKAPLRGINSLAEWILEDLTEVESEEVKYNLSLMKSRVAKMEQLIKDILEYSKIGFGDIPFENCDLNEILNDVVFEYVGSSNITIDLEKPLPELWVKRTAIFRLFSNLIGNAVKHSDKQQVKVVVGFKEYDNYFEFRIKDNGPGIPDEYKQTVFDMFSVLDPKNRNQNSGVGLSIAQRVVERHQGTIHIESNSNKGAIFVFTIVKDLGTLNSGAA